MIMFNLLRKFQQEKCPVCNKDNVFNSKGNVFLFKVPAMKEKCSNCGYRFEKEPGYFTGAMYVSYGLCIIEMVMVLMLFKLIALPMDYLIYVISLMIFVLWPFNFRMSRIIWMHLV